MSKTKKQTNLIQGYSQNFSKRGSHCVKVWVLARLSWHVVSFLLEKAYKIGRRGIMSTPEQSQLRPWYPRCRSLSQCALAVTFSKRVLSKITSASLSYFLSTPPGLFLTLLPYSPTASLLPPTILLPFRILI